MKRGSRPRVGSGRDARQRSETLGHATTDSQKDGWKGGDGVRQGDKGGYERWLGVGVWPALARMYTK